MGKRDHVGFQKLRLIAKCTAEMYGLAMPTADEARAAYCQKGSVDPLPARKRCENGVLWVDKYYVAYQLCDGDVQYTYISRCHIHEELFAYQQTSQLRGYDVGLPPDIQRCFDTATEYMRFTGKRWWIAPRIIVRMNEYRELSKGYQERCTR